MKNTIPILFLLCFLVGCNHQEPTRQETITKYYNARDAANYDVLKTTINDSITIIAGDYIMPYNHDSFYEQFRWDSVFRSSYKIVELEENNNQIIVTVAQNNLRNEFLKNNPLIYKQKISFTSGKISKLEELESIGTDWNVWNKERDSLVRWIERNHPELDGFIDDMTMNGSMNYLSAIKLYKNRKSLVAKFK